MLPALLLPAATVAVYVYGGSACPTDATASGARRHARAPSIPSAVAAPATVCTVSVPETGSYVAVPVNARSALGLAGSTGAVYAASVSIGTCASNAAPSGPTSVSASDAAPDPLVGQITESASVPIERAGAETTTHPLATHDVTTVPRGNDTGSASGEGTPRLASAVRAGSTAGAYVVVVATTVSIGDVEPYA